MRLLVLGGLVVVAMGFALLYMVTHGSESVAAVTQVSTPATTPAPVTTPAAATRVAGEPAHAPTAPVARPWSAAAPTLVLEAALDQLKREDPKKPKHIDTPTDKLRWALMRAIRVTEPAVVDCLNQAKTAGTKVDGVSSYFFYIRRSGDKILFDGAETDESPYPDPLKSCLQNAAKDVVVASMPDDVERVQVLRRLTVEHGEIAVYKLGAYHIIDPSP